jgi:hypothetical protein
MPRVVSIGIAELDEGVAMLSSLMVGALEFNDIFPKPWVYVQIPALILLVVIIVFYIRWKRKQM